MNSDAWGALNKALLMIIGARPCSMNISQNFVNLFESVIRLVPAMSRNFRDIMLYDKCIGDKLLSHTSINTRTSTRCTDFSLRHLENNSISYPLLLVVCLFGFDIAFKHLRSYHDGACL